MARRKAQMSGLFDWFKKLAPPSPGAMIPYAAPSSLPAAPKKESRQLSFFDFLSSEKERQERGLILPQIPKPTAMFEFMAPAPPAPVREEEKRLEQEVWAQMFKPSEEPLPPSEEMFEFLKPETIHEARYPHPDMWVFGEPPIWSDTRWQMPTTYELAELIHRKWDLPGMYEYVLSQVETPWWKRRVEESAHTGEPAALDVELVSAAKAPYKDMGNFLNIPDYVIERYGRYGHEGLQRFTLEVLQPMLERVGKALDVFRPTPVLRGSFELEPDQDMNFWIRYKERKQYPQLGR